MVMAVDGLLQGDLREAVDNRRAFLGMYLVCIRIGLDRAFVRSEVLHR